MAESVIQTSFAAGEISPNLFGRVDLDKYHVGAELMRNFFVDYRGGASTRPGTELIDRTKYPDRLARLIPFIFSQGQSYVLEFGHLYIRFFYQGKAILETPKPIVNIASSNPGAVNVINHGFSAGDDVFITGVVGMTEVNDRTYHVDIIDANNFTLWTQDNVPVNTSLYQPYISGGTVARVYEVATPYQEQDLALLKYVQSADVMTITHPSYTPNNLSRTSPSTFVLANIVIGPQLPAPGIVNAVPTTAGNLSFGYVVCAVSSNNEVGIPSALITCDSAALDPTPATGTPKVIAIYWDAVAGADHYNIYKWGPVYNSQPKPTIYGFIGQTNDVQFTDTNIAPDFSDNPPEGRNPFLPGPTYPGCVTYFQQRRVYGGFSLAPEEIAMSQVGSYDNFDVSLSVKDSDGITISIAARQVNEIKSMVPMSSGLVVLTTGGAFQITGGSAQTAVTPTNVTALPQASTGANDLPPIVVNYDILFVQNKGSIVRDLAYNFYLQTFYGFDRSTLANHLFFNHKLLEWSYAEEPFKIIWVVRDDGHLLSLTYVPEQEVYGWARHDTQGEFESVCVVPEGQEDSVYFVVHRPESNGSRTRYIERMASRKWGRIEDAWCLDCAVKLVLDRPSFALDMSANSEFAFIQAFPQDNQFDSTWLNKIIWFDIGGKLKIISISTPNQIVCEILEPIGNQIPNTDPPQFNRVEIGEWEVGPEVSSISGLDHLSGLPAVVLADGQAWGPFIVPDNGTIAIDPPASKILAGLPYQCQLQTLQLDTGDPTIQGKRKLITAITARLDQSRGLKYGQSFSDSLVAFKEVPPAGYTPPIPLLTMDERIVITGTWQTHGQLVVQQDYPFPATVLGLIPEVTFGDNQR